MVRLDGEWEGSGSNHRVVCGYDRTYNSDRTRVRYDARFYYESRYSVYDTSNSWELSGGMGAENGGSVAVNHGGSGGMTLFHEDAASSQSSDISVSFWVRGIEAAGATIGDSFTLTTGGLYTEITSFTADTITASSFRANIISSDANGETRTNAQVQWNTTASATGADSKTAGGWVDITVTGLNRDTLYYYRMRAANSALGWGPWTGWKSVRTLPTVPGKPDTSWSIVNITQTEAHPTGLNASVSDNGGESIDNWQAQWNTSASTSGASSASSGAGNVAPDLTDLEPGTVYYVRIRGHNTVGWSEWSNWKSFQTLPGVLVRYGGTYRNAVPYVKYLGVWRQATRYVKYNGVWR